MGGTALAGLPEPAGGSPEDRPRPTAAPGPRRPGALVEPPATPAAPPRSATAPDTTPAHPADPPTALEHPTAPPLLAPRESANGPDEEDGRGGPDRPGDRADHHTPDTPANTRPRTAAAPLSDRRVHLVFAGLMLALLLAALEQTIVVTALPKIVGDLHGLGRMSWALTAYLLASTIVLPVYGRLGDLFGRKPVFQFAILAFVAGSALAGWSHTMDQLIAFRAVQGVGGGGLVVGVQAIMADILPPRRRGRYLGLIHADAGLAAVAGPLLGGVLTDHLSWRWCFYLDVPLGLITFAVVTAVLRLPRPTTRPRPDVPGALLLSVASTSVVLLTSWGGTRYPWHSRIVIALAAAAAGSLLLFLVAERFAAQPLMPPRLFRNGVFVVSAIVAAVTGVALWGTAGYLPGFLQMVDGASATGSGLLMLPMKGGLMVASIASGLLVSRTGRYKVHPVLGCALAATGLWLLSGFGTGTARPVYSAWLIVFGLGVGLTLPVLVLAVQNAVDPVDLGAATSALDYFRHIGGSVGAAVIGALFTHRLAARLAAGPPATDAPPPDPDSLTPRLVHAIPPALRTAYVHAYATAMPRIFLYLVPVVVVGLLAAFLLKEKPLLMQAQPLIPEARNGGAGVPVCGTVQHSDGTIVARAALTLIDSAGRQIGRGATGDDGRYALSTPGNGSFVLIAAAGGHQPQAVTVTVGERPVELDIVLGGAGRLAGAVLTADGTPVREAVVTLTDVRGEVVATTRTGPDGCYVLTDLVAGEYTLAASAPAYRPAALPVSVQAARETRQDVELAGGAVLRGVVRASGGRPVEEARVTLLDAAGNVVDTVTTGADGVFRFVDLAAGSYTVIASGYPPVATVLQVAGGGRTERDLQLGHED
ncbi:MULTISPECIES: MFS transporter [Streptomycetaceae]|uniref:Transmembrane efflux protein n=1 Tax=Streptantibioticus cattleyicolor (strain ATCC 35852 / DSM 46488 / JCM 4925 / NBRC 14057 / NRRL 8057) TaxID=1003195 RepID=F8JYL0_STREN|nr:MULTISPECIES: MFS transporter [Streptomycetaceae]AEW97229.1 transmembrane efflux protein [Streptantibioticus cattleyicolor NRRL 8057 = DSM 46488]MYS61684.1 DHA2 family efflux MFS transporter permease subunit [Streptomyces sp. SID5468]CCB77552.1 putative efflux protein [Streptantibioticus cattleyicolor NRRL 8057 = DSM 46488]